MKKITLASAALFATLSLSAIVPAYAYYTILPPTQEQPAVGNGDGTGNGTGNGSGGGCASCPGCGGGSGAGNEAGTQEAPRENVPMQ